MACAFQIVSYNILADSYINPQWYSHTDPEIIRWDRRSVALCRRIESFGAEVICLQEVEEDAYALFEHNLRKKGYSGAYARKGSRKPDGCATFFKQEKLEFQSSKAVYYRDGEGALDSGHLALISSFEYEVGTLRVANTHLRWDREHKPRVEHVGYRQIKELIDHQIKTDTTADAWIICGDFNAQPDSPVIEELLSNGFEDAYQGREQYTCNPNRQAKRIDYIFHTKNLKAEPAKLMEIDDLTPLPSEVEPSDHLAVSAIVLPRHETNNS